MDEKIRSLIYQTIAQTISREDFERLQDVLEHDQAVREEYIQIVGLCESLSEIAVDASFDSESSKSTSTSSLYAEDTSRRNRRRLLGSQFSIAAGLLLLVGIGAFSLGRWNQPMREQLTTPSEQTPSEPPETRIAGHATLKRVVDLKWPNDDVRRFEGDILPNGPFVFDTGMAEIDFFCGATLIVEGPAELEIESDWSVRVTRGRLRANVPPAARGFVVKAADSEIIDLGTEFALDVSSETARVEVLDGEVKLRGGKHDGKHLVTGEGASLRGVQTDASLTEGLSTTLELSQQRHEADERLLAQWKTFSQQLRNDKRLIAYYPIAEGLTRRFVPNKALSGSELDGLIVGPVEQAEGRFGQESAGLSFDRLGARVRTRIDGDFQAFTFACWVRIDRLEHRYNALFMSDGYENGELHWQIRNDGCLMFSVMVDDTQSIRHYSELEQREVETAGLARIYFSEPIWDLSKSGQWFHLAAVYDSASRRVVQYANGNEIGTQEITDKFHIDTLRIGPAEIGNWGQPFRKTPSFAVRNLNGTIDELAIFKAPLTSDEIRELYEKGKPLGY